MKQFTDTQIKMLLSAVKLQNSDGTWIDLSDEQQSNELYTKLEAEAIERGIDPNEDYQNENNFQFH